MYSLCLSAWRHSLLGKVLPPYAFIGIAPSLLMAWKLAIRAYGVYFVPHDWDATDLGTLYTPEVIWCPIIQERLSWITFDNRVTVGCLKPQSLPKQPWITTPHQGLTCANHISLTLAPIWGTLNPLAVKPPDYSRRSFGRVLAWTLARSSS
jgi:hypothetical protein